MESIPDERDEKIQRVELATQLRDYQRKAVAWMIAREQADHEETAVSAEVDSQWRVLRTRSGEDFYFNEVRILTWLPLLIVILVHW